MHLVEIFLPLYDRRGKRFPSSNYKAEREMLVERFGGMTAHTRAPVKGLWKDKGETEKDDLVIFEVIVMRLDRRWWKSYRRQLEKNFNQKELLVRAHSIRKL